MNNSPNKRPLFKYNKKLGTSKYNELLTESDDEEYFKTKPVNKEGKDFEFVFKIDAFRD